MTFGRFTADEAAAFLSRLVEQPAPTFAAAFGPCQGWTGAAGADGYGNVSIRGVTHRTHLVGFELYNGREPQDEVVRHRCGRRLCAAGRHLVEGTHRQNLADQVAHGTYSPPPVMTCESHPSSKLRTDDVRRAMDRLERGEATQQEIADELGIAQSRVSQIFNGQGWRCR